jgi:flavin reductase (DIM6/NTAB) family NADH-FMN oxidoreductase RutF
MDESAKKRALKLIPYTLFVVGARLGEEMHAFTGSWLTQASFKPPMVVIGVKRTHRSNEMMRESGVFSLNFLDESQQEVAKHFFRSARMNADRLGSYAYKEGKNGCPLLEVALAHVECQVRNVMEAGDHTLFLGEILDAIMLRDAPPLELKQTGWHYGG